jgi:hypothetical protein
MIKTALKIMHLTSRINLTNVLGVGVCTVNFLSQMYRKIHQTND